MRLNEEVVLYCGKIVLLPYRAEHVPIYHAWMSRPELLQMTESDKLSLEEEFTSMKAWREDPNKLTFLIYDRGLRRLVGDVNVIINVDAEVPKRAEVDVMIAEPLARRRGLSVEALQIAMKYSVSRFGPESFIAKILEINRQSIALFEKLGFTLLRRVEAFKELHYELCSSELGTADVDERAIQWTEGSYKEFLTQHPLSTSSQ